MNYITRRIYASVSVIALVMGLKALHDAIGPIRSVVLVLAVLVFLRGLSEAVTIVRSWFVLKESNMGHLKTR